MRATAVLLCLAACGTDHGSGSHGDVNGLYESTRTVTQSEPSPAFVIPTMLQISVSGDEIMTTIGTGVTTPEVHHSDDAVHFTFVESETWTSPEGDGAVTLTYALELKDVGTLTGSIGAKIIFDSPSIHTDFDYGLDITGMKLTR